MAGLPALETAYRRQQECARAIARARSRFKNARSRGRLSKSDQSVLETRYGELEDARYQASVADQVLAQLLAAIRAELPADVLQQAADIERCTGTSPVAALIWALDMETFPAFVNDPQYCAHCGTEIKWRHE